MSPQKPPPFVQTPGLSSETAIAHGFFSRIGGVSQAPYDSLNAGPGSNDDPANVAENRQRCALGVGADPANLVTLHQIHSAKVIVADKAWRTDARQGDALVTKTPALLLGVLTADCMPFLFADAQAGVIGAAHAGWRGALAGVLEATVEAMTALGASPGRITAALGPCLRQGQFEVGLDLVDAFTSTHASAERFFSPGVSENKRQFDLAGFASMRLNAVGVDRIEDLGVCTLGQMDRYFSYRGSRRQGLADYGRNLSAIMLRV